MRRMERQTPHCFCSGSLFDSCFHFSFHLWFQPLFMVFCFVCFCLRCFVWFPIFHKCSHVFLISQWFQVVVVVVVARSLVFTCVPLLFLCCSFVVPFSSSRCSLCFTSLSCVFHLFSPFAFDVVLFPFCSFEDCHCHMQRTTSLHSVFI